jgi:hypothetical protein
MAYPKEVNYDARRDLGFAAIGAAYAAVGVPFTRPVRLIKLVNRTNQDMDVSANGVTDHDILPSNSFYLYDLSSNKIRDEGAFFKTGSGVWVKSTSGVAPTSGSVYAVVIAGAV